jgi:diguanylate cyclase (GGDEF)-like protein/PAS domain S-box-containing protein
VRFDNCQFRQWLHVPLRFSALLGLACRLVRPLGTMAAIIKRKEVPAWIVEGRDNLARAERMARLGYIKFDQGSSEYTWSEGVYRIMGKAPEFFTPTLCATRELIQPDGRAVLDQYRRDVMAGLEPPPLTLNAIKDDGQIVCVELFLAPIRANNGTVTGMFGTCQDVTERKQAEEALSNLNQELIEKQFAIDQAVIVAITDVKGRITYANDNFCRISGYTRDELLGENHRILNSGIHSKSVFTDMYRQIATGQVWRGELCNKAKDGSHYWVDTIVVPQLGPHGKPIAYMAIRIDISARKLAEEKISYMASHDALTGIGNRVVLHEKLEEALARLRFSQGTFSIFILDLDGFKYINDTLGHAAGDDLLKQLAHRLNSSLHESDILTRLGGDEFAIIQNGQPNQREAAIELAVKLLEIVSSSFNLDGHRVSVGTSIGIALAPEDGVDSGELLKKADLALYRVKAEGRNSFRFFDAEMSKDTRARHQLLNDLRGALARKEFELHYQSIIDTKTREVRGFEALVRWRHPVDGLLSPDRFIWLAEETGLIEPLGDWILEQACADATSWPADIKVAVNLSAVQFRTGRLFDVILCVLVESGLPPERLELEITESVLLQNKESHGIAIQQLKNLGISISLDDFGTGYSALSYLATIPFDKIKIDKSFTQGLANRADCAAIVASVLTLARGLDMAVTAEGVETSQQFELLRMAGVHQVQGYLFSRPVPGAELNFSAPEVKGRSIEAV